MKLTDKLIDDFIGHVKRGARVTAACQLLEISRRTYYDWNERGLTLLDEIEDKIRKRKDLTKNQKLYIKFHQDVGKAFVERELSLIAKIEDSDKWQAQAWILERQFREHYAPRRYLDTEAFVKAFRRENSEDLTKALQKVLEFSEAVRESEQTYDELELQGEKLRKAAGLD